MSGRVKSYNTKKGFGFVDFGGRDIFILNRHLIGRCGLVAGETVEFELVMDEGRPQARRVKVTASPPLRAPAAPVSDHASVNPLSAMKQAMAVANSLPSAHEMTLAMAAAAAAVPTTFPTAKDKGDDDLFQKIRDAQSQALSGKRQPPKDWQPPQVQTIMPVRSVDERVRNDVQTEATAKHSNVSNTQNVPAKEQPGVVDVSTAVSQPDAPTNQALQKSASEALRRFQLPQSDVVLPVGTGWAAPPARPIMPMMVPGVMPGVPPVQQTLGLKAPSEQVRPPHLDTAGGTSRAVAPKGTPLEHFAKAPPQATKNSQSAEPLAVGDRPSPDGHAGARWRVLHSDKFQDVIVRETIEVSSREVRRVCPGEEVLQRGGSVRVSSGLVRMPIEPTGWVTMHARHIGGPSFLEEVSRPAPPPDFQGAKATAPAEPSKDDPWSRLADPWLQIGASGKDGSIGEAYSREQLLSARLWCGSPNPLDPAIRMLHVPTAEVAVQERREREPRVRERQEVERHSTEAEARVSAAPDGQAKANCPTQ